MRLRASPSAASSRITSTRLYLGNIQAVLTMTSEVVPEPVVSHTDEKDADNGADLISETGRRREGAAFLGEGDADAQSGHPDRLPGEEVKGAGVLQRNLRVVT